MFDPSTYLLGISLLFSLAHSFLWGDTLSLIGNTIGKLEYLEWGD